MDLDEQPTKLDFFENQLCVEGRLSQKDNLWVSTGDCVHSHKGRINKITEKSQRILMNEARHMDLTIMKAGEKGQEQ